MSAIFSCKLPSKFSETICHSNENEKCPTYHPCRPTSFLCPHKSLFTVLAEQEKPSHVNHSLLLPSSYFTYPMRTRTAPHIAPVVLHASQPSQKPLYQSCQLENGLQTGLLPYTLHCVHPIQMAVATAMAMWIIRPQWGLCHLRIRY